VVRPPLPLPGFSMSCFAPELSRNDPASAWLRRELKHVARLLPPA
jgi:hypothetical protein